MIATYVDVDPDGDVRAILSEPIGPFAPGVQVEDPLLPDVTCGSNLTSTDNGNDTENPVNAAKEDVAADMQRDVLQTAPPTEFRLRLSSKHLMLASPRLRKMYHGDWKEATDRDEDGLLTWRVGDLFDPGVFITVMKVIHGRNRDVPRVVDLESLAKIAVVTDYLMCHESMEILSVIWMNELKGSIPDTYCRDLILWIIISSIFRDQDAFSSATRTAILRSDKEVPSIGIPIHEDVINKIEGQRQDLLDQVLGSLYNTVDLLRAGLCNPECDAMLLGSLIKQMKVVDLLQPRLSRPVHGVSVAMVVEAITNLSSPTWYHSSEVELESAGYDRWGYTRKKNKKVARKASIEPEPELGEVNTPLDDRREGHPCTLGVLFCQVKGLEAGARGLDLEAISG